MLHKILVLSVITSLIHTNTKWGKDRIKILKRWSAPAKNSIFLVLHRPYKTAMYGFVYLDQYFYKFRSEKKILNINSSSYLGLGVLSGIVAFLCVEKLVRFHFL